MSKEQANQRSSAKVKTSRAAHDTGELKPVMKASVREAGTTSPSNGRRTQDKEAATLYQSSTTTPSHHQAITHEEMVNTFLYNSTFSFWVGPQCHTFHVHQEHLLAISPHLESERTREGGHMIHNSIVNFGTTEPRIFNYFVHWLYTDVFMTKDEAESTKYEDLIELYVIGEKLQAAVLKNAVLNEIAQESYDNEEPLPRGLLNRVYKVTEPDSSLRKLWVDLYIERLSEDELAEDMDSVNLHQDFLEDLTLVLVKKLKDARIIASMDAAFWEVGSSYHQIDAHTGACCIRPQFHGTGREHRGDCIIESEHLKTRLYRAGAKVEDRKQGSSVTVGKEKKRKLKDTRDIDD